MGRRASGLEHAELEVLLLEGGDQMAGGDGARGGELGVFSVREGQRLQLGLSSLEETVD